MTSTLRQAVVFGGLLTSAGTLAAVANAAIYWSQHETLRMPPVSQAGFFGALGAIAILGVAVGWAALRARDLQSSIMLAASGAIALEGAIASGAGSGYAVPVFYVGLLGLVTSVASLTTAQRPLVKALAGVVLAGVLFALLVLVLYLVSRTLP
jgi:hypothetical protein